MYAHLRSGRRGRSRFGACLEGSRHPRRRRLFPIGGRPLGSPRIGAERASVLAIKPGQSRSRQPRRQAAPPLRWEAFGSSKEVRAVIASLA